ncbi:MAG: CHRD domain-containing protein [Bryobacteraceae bacterium]
MSPLQKNARLTLVTAAVLAALLSTGCSSMQSAMNKMGLGGSKATSDLTGTQEVPPVSTNASGKSTISVASDKSVSGSVITDAMTGTAAHIHQGAMGANGPVIIPLTKTSDKAFTVPANTKLTDAQYDAYRAGNLYVNVHSAAHPAGEIRVQMKP